jgi:hypothetical protein
MDTRALNESEMSTLLAALQLWQRELCRSGLPEWADEYFRDCEPLTIDQIDELCEQTTKLIKRQHGLVSWSAAAGRSARSKVQANR